MRHHPRPLSPTAPAATGLVAVLIVLAAVFLIGWSAKEQETWEQWCRAEGGHIDRTSETVPMGTRPYIRTDYTYYCLSPDGRILDIKG